MGFENNLVTMLLRIKKEIEKFERSKCLPDSIAEAKLYGRIEALSEIHEEVLKYFEEIS